MATNDGGPAFPQLYKVGSVAKSEGGLSVRDWFAGQALKGIMANEGAGLADAFAAGNGEQALLSTVSIAYFVADAMLKARDAAQENQD